MNVKPCRDCGKPVSSKASACPHCGSKSFDIAHAVGRFGIDFKQLGCALLMLLFVLIGLAFLLLSILESAKKIGRFDQL